MLRFSIEGVAPKLASLALRNAVCETVSGHGRIMVGSFSAGTALCEPPCADYVAGAALCEPPCADYMAGTALCEPPCAEFVAGTALCEPPCADFVAGAIQNAFSRDSGRTKFRVFQ